MLLRPRKVPHQTRKWFALNVFVCRCKSATRLIRHGDIEFLVDQEGRNGEGLNYLSKGRSPNASSDVEAAGS